mgnify:CR=1 FL=1
MGIKINQISIIIILLIVELCECQLKIEDKEAGGQCVFLISNSVALDFHNLTTYINE